LPRKSRQKKGAENEAFPGCVADGEWHSMKCRPRVGSDIGPSAGRPSHRDGSDKAITHPTPHCVRRRVAGQVATRHARAVTNALKAGSCGALEMCVAICTYAPRETRCAGHIAGKHKGRLEMRSDMKNVLCRSATHVVRSGMNDGLVTSCTVRGTVWRRTYIVSDARATLHGVPFPACHTTLKP
jgi:hypothetical protein